MRPLLLFGWLVCLAAAAKPSMPSAPAVRQADYAPARAAALPQMHGLLVSHRGQIVLEYYARGYSAGRLANITSAAKSIIAALAGIAIGSGSRVRLRLVEPDVQRPPRLLPQALLWGQA